MTRKSFIGRCPLASGDGTLGIGRCPLASGDGTLGIGRCPLASGDGTLGIGRCPLANGGILRMVLEIRDLDCGYEKNKPVVTNVNMEMTDGDICCLLGPNGVGKTTLFKTMLALIAPLRGQVCIDGSDVSKWPLKKRARYLAYVAQAHVPSFPYLVKDIVMMGRLGQMGAASQPGRHDYEVAEQALEDVGIRHLRDMVYTEISGGERQLLMIAKALAQEPKVLIMDEPTANLDYGNMVTVMSCIRSLAQKGLCIVFTTHMPDQAFMCRAKTAIMFRGEPLIFGDCNDVITEKNLYEAYHTQMQILEVLDASGSPVKVCTPRFDRFDTLYV